MRTSNYGFRLGVSGAILGAVFLGLATSAMAWNEPLWVRQFGTEGRDEAYGVATDAKGNVYLTGATEGSLGGPNQGLHDAWVAKYNSAGRVLWRGQLGTADEDKAIGVATDSAGNVYLAGCTACDEGFGSWSAKYNAAGRLAWKKQLRSDGFISGVATDAIGNVYFTGTGRAMGTIVGWVAKYESGGNELWSRQFLFKGTSSVRVDAVATDAKGHVYLTGIAAVDPSIWTVGWVAKYDTNGRVLWRRQFDLELSGGGTVSGAESYGWAVLSVAADAKGDVYLTGTDDPHGLASSWGAKYDSSGRKLWFRRLDFGWPTVSTVSTGVVTDAESNFYLSGVRWGDVYWNAFVAKYDSTGRVLWQRQLGTFDNAESFNAVALDRLGNLYAAGSTDYDPDFPWGVGPFDVLVAKYSTRP